MRIKKGSIIQGCDYHIHLVTGVCGDDIEHVSITNIGQPGSCSKMHCAPRALSVNETERLLGIYAKDGILGLAMERGWTREGYEKFVKNWRTLEEYEEFVKRYGSVLMATFYSEEG